MSIISRVQRTCVVTFMVALTLQFYAAGLAVFGATTFAAHAVLGYGLVIGAATLATLTAAARLPRRAVLMAIAIVVLTVLQPVLALVPRVGAPALSALHTVNALGIVLLAGAIAWESRPRRVAAAGVSQNA
jgi:hypothetical protein